MGTFFTPLIEPANAVGQAVPAGFNVNMAYLLGQCCSLTYAQYDAGIGWQPNFSSLTALGDGNLTASAVQTFTMSEANGPASSTGDAGAYDTVAGGFAVTLTQTKPIAGTPPAFVVIALRGTQTWEEWFDDSDALPAAWRDIDNPIDGLGTVHGGIFGLYTMGSDGTGSTFPFDPRLAGSPAAQVAAYVSKLTAKLPVYVTGHSLGGALAALCAFDVASNFAANAGGVAMYSLASPRVVTGISDVPTLDNQELFLQNYQQAVPASFRIVNAADIAPVLPPSVTTLGALTLSCAHVTDAWTYEGSSGSALVNNVISFGAQTGDVGGNHSCLNTYVPYLQSLAQGF